VTLFDPPRPAEPPPPTVRVRLTVAYDGAGFHGFAAQPGVKTVGGTLAKALERVLGYPVELTCAGRTDTGVHAQGQVVSFDAAEAGLDQVTLCRAVNKMCGPSIAVRDAAVVASDFDARFSATARVYRYTIWNNAVPDPFTATTAWQVDRPLDLAAMRLACDPLIGEHDFTSFCRRPDPDATLVRRVRDASWERNGDTLWFWIEANAFCHQMVRSIVGTLVDVGAGRKRAGHLAGILRAQDRAVATGKIAPAHGLCLWSVTYPT
jgi:tRNA pseudouridine38-40 synthase